jgi:hypothetical protein
MSGDAGDLAGAIAALRADLESAIREGDGKDVKFELGEIELTLQLIATKHGGGKVGWSVLGIDAGAESARTHAVKLTLTPRHRAADGTYTTVFAAITEPIKISPNIGNTLP